MLATLLFILPQVPAGEPTVTVAREVMGVRFEVELTGVTESRALELAEPAFAAAELAEALFSMWDEDSAIRRLNADPSPGAVPVEKALAVALEGATRMCAETGGAFDPSVGAVLDRLGYYEQRGVPPLDDAERAALAARVGCGVACARWDVEGDGAWVWRARPDVALDLTGMAKGWAVDLALEELRHAGVEDVRVAAGPSAQRALGDGPAGDGWPVSVPGPAGLMETWLLRDEAVCSSGQRSFTARVDGQEVSHVIDPRTLRPVAHDTRTTVVRAPSTVEADLASTALLVLGAEEGAAWLRARPREARWLRARFLRGDGEAPEVVDVRSPPR